MTAAELSQLRDVLASRRRGLIGQLATDTSGVSEPGFLRLVADTHIAIAAVDAALAESAITGDAP
jgi:hypothetical protein